LLGTNEGKVSRGFQRTSTRPEGRASGERKKRLGVIWERDAAKE